MTTKLDTQAAIKAAYEQYSTADTTIALATLVLVAEAVREDYPAATTITAGWSDQGPHLYDAPTIDAGLDSEDDDWYDDHGYLSNLDEGNQSTWAAFATDPGGRRSHEFTFNIDTLLTDAAAALAEHTSGTHDAEDASRVSRNGVEVIITRSAGTDGAVVVFVDTEFEPDGSDGGPGLRVRINDDTTYVGTPYVHDESKDDDGKVSSMAEATEDAYRALVESDEKTCSGMPTQWEGKLRDGRVFYFRYLWGHAALRVHAENPFDMGALVASLEVGDRFDGDMTDADYRRTFLALHARLEV